MANFSTQEQVLFQCTALHVSIFQHTGAGPILVYSMICQHISAHRSWSYSVYSNICQHISAHSSRSYSVYSIICQQISAHSSRSYFSVWQISAHRSRSYSVYSIICQQISAHSSRSYFSVWQISAHRSRSYFSVQHDMSEYFSTQDLVLYQCMAMYVSIFQHTVAGPIQCTA